MSELRRRRFVDVVFIDALFTIAAGSFLYWHDWHTYPSFGDWIGSNFGAALTVGALLAISAITSPGSSIVPLSVGSYPSEGRPKATEVERVCKRCGTSWYAHKGSVFTQPMSGSEALSVGMSWTATAARASEGKRCH
jgi:hypothetical protein